MISNKRAVISNERYMISNIWYCNGNWMVTDGCTVWSKNGIKMEFSLHPSPSYHSWKHKETKSCPKLIKLKKLQKSHMYIDTCSLFSKRKAQIILFFCYFLIEKKRLKEEHEKRFFLKRKTYIFLFFVWTQYLVLM